MRRITFQVFILLSLAWIIFQMSGCTLIGLGIGATIDAVTPPKPTAIRSWMEIRNIHAGKDVSVVFKDGRLLKGVYTGIKTIPEAEYAEVYAISREREKDAQLPGLGEKLTILTAGRDRQEIKFLGFDLNAAGEASLYIGSGGPGDAARVPIAIIREIRPQEGDALDLDRIIGLLIAGQIPLLSGVGLTVKRGAEISNEIFSLSEIGQIDVTDKRKG